MLQLSTTTDTQLGVKFTVTNMTVTGFTASIEINGKLYALSPVANDAVAVVTIPLADATAITTVYFGARVTVYDSDGNAYQVSGWPGMKVPYALDELTVDNFIRIDLAPPFPIPEDGGGGGGGGTVKSVNNVSPDSSGNVELTSDVIRPLAQYDQTEVASSDISTEIQLSSDSANIYDFTQLDSTDDVTIKMPLTPSTSAGKVADVLVRIDTGANVPGVTFYPSSDVFCPMDGDAAFGTLEADSMNFFSFTSMGTDGSGNRVWMVGHYSAAFQTP